MKNKIFPGIILYGLILFSGYTRIVTGEENSANKIKGENPRGNSTGFAIKEPSGEINLKDALEAALAGHPEIEASIYEIKAKEGAAKQAGLLPNPKIFGEIDEFGGSGNFSGTDIMETSMGVSQEIPLGGKYSKNRKVAGVDVKLAKLDRITTYLELRKTVQKRFLKVFTLQEILDIEKKNLESLTSAHNAINKRVESGDLSPLDLNRANVEMFSSMADVKVLENELEAARYVLASSWGSTSPLFNTVKSEYTEIPETPDDTTLLKALERSPGYIRLKMQVTRGDAELDLAKANFWPDIEIGGAYRTFEESDDHAYLIELSIPVPFFNRNQGGIREANQNLNKIRKEQEAGIIELRNNAVESLKRMNAIRAWYITSRDIILPAANNAFEAVSLAYNEGESNYIELLDAQRTLLQAKRSHVERLSEYMELKSDLDALIPEENLIPAEYGLKTK